MLKYNIITSRCPPPPRHAMRRFIAAAAALAVVHAAGLEQVNIFCAFRLPSFLFFLAYVSDEVKRHATSTELPAASAPPPAQIHISYTGEPGEIAIDFVSDVATGE